jgi:hypothetical protein
MPLETHRLSSSFSTGVPVFGNVLDISSLGGPPLPSVQNLLNALTNQSVAIRDLIAVPSQDEEKLNHLSLQIRPIILGKHWNLRRKTYAVGAKWPCEECSG